MCTCTLCTVCSIHMITNFRVISDCLKSLSNRFDLSEICITKDNLQQASYMQHFVSLLDYLALILSGDYSMSIYRASPLDGWRKWHPHLNTKSSSYLNSPHFQAWNELLILIYWLIHFITLNFFPIRSNNKISFAQEPFVLNSYSSHIKQFLYHFYFINH